VHKHHPSGVAMEEKKSEFDPATEEAIQSALDVQSTFLDTLR
jgi:hypothetical protein